MAVIWVKLQNVSLNLFIKRFNKIPGVVAAVNLAGVHGEPCGAVTVQRTVPQGSPHTPAECIAATTPGLIIRILKFWFYILSENLN